MKVLKIVALSFMVVILTFSFITITKNSALAKAPPGDDAGSKITEDFHDPETCAHVTLSWCECDLTPRNCYPCTRLLPRYYASVNDLPIEVQRMIANNPHKEVELDITIKDAKTGKVFKTMRIRVKK